jgi:NAD(P)-dependent dehydrogenase (short-subunit alcohol dehydrogenase family)
VKAYETDLFNLEGRVAIVVGAGGGIGSAIAYALAAYGADIMAVSRALEEAQIAAKKIAETGRRVIPHELEITRSEEIEEMVERACQDFGHIDILVNSAGINIRKPVLEIQPEDWDPVLDINLTGVLFCCQAVARVMITQQKGKIINIASISSRLGHPARCAYAASKGGLVQITRVMATEWAPFNINVNAISPAAVDTPFIEDLKKSPGRLERELARIPLGRIGTPEDIMGAAVFLASDSSDFITGQNLLIDGGRTID